MLKRFQSLSLFVVAFLPGIAHGSAIVNFDDGKVFRINDNISQVVLVYRGRFFDWSEASMASPAGIRKSLGYATSRKIEGDRILQANEGVNGLVWSRWFKGGSIQTSYYPRKELFENVKYRGYEFSEMEDEGIAAYRNYLITKKAMSNDWEANVDFSQTYKYSQECEGGRARWCVVFNGAGNDVVCHYNDFEGSMISNETGYECDPYVLRIAENNKI